MKYSKAKSPVDFALLHQLYPERYPYLLESVAAGPKQARYDILFAFPQDVLQLDLSAGLTLNNKPIQGDFLSLLQHHWLEASQANTPQDTSRPFSGGWFVFFSYDFASEIEPCLRLPASSRTTPLAVATRIPAAMIYDHDSGEMMIGVEEGFESLLAGMQADVENRPQPVSEPLSPLVSVLKEEPDDKFLLGVAEIKKYIKDGDVFQVNLSRLWEGDLKPGVEAVDVYRALRQSNPSPFAGLAKFGEHTICSSSPERLVSVAEGVVSTRPIAGTHPRSSNEVEDVALAAKLLAHPKERAEHIMLIDLERNDLGRVCVPGSVTVDELMTVETYTHVHHIVSNVCGDLKAEVTPSDVIAATFTGGTITGCPKVRCMEIISS